MIRPTDETFLPFHLNEMYTYQGPFKKAIPVAQHYGFRLIQPIKNQVATPQATVAKTTSSHRTYRADLNHKFSSLQNYLENQETFSQPALLCHTQNASKKDGYLNLDIYGVEDSFVETLLLKSAYEILVTEGYKNLLVEINSFGSTESYERFEGEVNKYLVKNLTKFSASDQKKLQENPFYLYELEHHQEGELDESLSEILLHRPRPVAHLSETCRIHLKDLLEHLEETGMPYHLNPHLFPQSGKHCETVYTIVNQDNDETLAYGERFTTQARSLTQKSMANEEGFVHCAAISIALAAGKAEKYTKVKETKKSTPHVYFAHSGAVAKRNTLNVLSMLHDANIAVKHAIIKNSLREQLYHCERNQSTELEFPVTLILGVKEMQDGTIIVRNNLANRQKAVPLNRMCSYVKRALK